MKFVDGNKRCCWACAPASIARALTVGLLFLPAFDAQAAVDTFQEGVSGYNDTLDTYVEENSPDTPQGTDTVVKVENSGGTRQQGLLRFDSIFGSGAGELLLNTP